MATRPSKSSLLFPNFHLMTTIRFHRLRAVFLSVCLFASFCVVANAADVLFEDDFQIAANEKTLDDINQGAESRQHGTLAPAAYSSNGEGWQCKPNIGSSGNSGIRLYPSANRIPLVLSPAWRLSEEPGEYSFALQIRPRSWTESEGPEKILIALGAGEGSGVKGAPPDLAGAVVFEINVNQTDGACSLRVLFDQAEAAPSVELSALSELTRLHDVTIRWKQAASKQVESLSVEIDGAPVFNLPKAGFTLQGSAVLFGGQVGPAQQPKSQFADMSVGEIQYVKE